MKQNVKKMIQFKVKSMLDETIDAPVLKRYFHSKFRLDTGIHEETSVLLLFFFKKNVVVHSQPTSPFKVNNNKTITP